MNIYILLLSYFVLKSLLKKDVINFSFIVYSQKYLSIGIPEVTQEEFLTPVLTVINKFPCYFNFYIPDGIPHRLVRRK